MPGKKKPGAVGSSNRAKEMNAMEATTTGEVDRVKRAWEYIYSHGCVGKKSPF